MADRYHVVINHAEELQRGRSRSAADGAPGLAEVAQTDPDYLQWMLDAGDFLPDVQEIVHSHLDRYGNFDEVG